MDRLPAVIGPAQAATLIGSTVPWTPSTRTMQRWATTGKHGGFRSRTTGRLLFRTAGLLRALRP